MASIQILVLSLSSSFDENSPPKIITAQAIKLKMKKKSIIACNHISKVNYNPY